MDIVAKPSAEGVVSVQVRLSENEKAERVREALALVTAEAGIAVAGEGAEDLRSAAIDRFGEETASRMLATYVMGRTAPLVAAELGVEPLVAPCPIDGSPILDDGDFTFALRIVARPTCALSSYEPVQSDELPRFAKEGEGAAGRTALLERILAERLVDEIPPAAYEAVRDGMLGDVYDQACREGKTLEDFLAEWRLDEGLLGMMLYDRAVDAVNREVALEALFEHHRWRVDEADRAEAAAALAPEREGDALGYLTGQGLAAVVDREARLRKARAWLDAGASEGEGGGCVESHKSLEIEAHDGSLP